MNGKLIINLAGATLLAGGLFAGSAGWTTAQDHPAGGAAHQHGSGATTAASRSEEATDDALTSTMRDIMDEMVPGMGDDMMAFMMDDMMSHMMGVDMMDDGMMGGMPGGGMHGDMHRDAEHGSGEQPAMRGMADSQHIRMQTVAAEALGLTVDELEAELAEGKTVRDIAEDQGVDIAELHETVMDQFASDGC